MTTAINLNPSNEPNHQCDGLQKKEGPSLTERIKRAVHGVVQVVSHPIETVKNFVSLSPKSKPKINREDFECHLQEFAQKNGINISTKQSRADAITQMIIGGIADHHPNLCSSDQVLAKLIAAFPDLSEQEKTALQKALNNKENMPSLEKLAGILNLSEKAVLQQIATALGLPEGVVKNILSTGSTTQKVLEELARAIREGMALATLLVPVFSKKENPSSTEIQQCIAQMVDIPPEYYEMPKEPLASQKEEPRPSLPSRNQGTSKIVNLLKSPFFFVPAIMTALIPGANAQAGSAPADPGIIPGIVSAVSNAFSSALTFAMANSMITAIGAASILCCAAVYLTYKYKQKPSLNVAAIDNKTPTKVYTREVISSTGAKWEVKITAAKDLSDDAVTNLFNVYQEQHLEKHPFPMISVGQSISTKIQERQEGGFSVDYTLHAKNPSSHEGPLTKTVETKNDSVSFAKNEILWEAFGGKGGPSIEAKLLSLSQGPLPRNARSTTPVNIEKTQSGDGFGAAMQILLSDPDMRMQMQTCPTPQLQQIVKEYEERSQGKTRDPLKLTEVRKTLPPNLQTGKHSIAEYLKAIQMLLDPDKKSYAKTTRHNSAYDKHNQLTLLNLDKPENIPCNSTLESIRLSAADLQQSQGDLQEAFNQHLIGKPAPLLAGGGTVGYPSLYFEKPPKQLVFEIFPSSQKLKAPEILHLPRPHILKGTKSDLQLRSFIVQSEEKEEPYGISFEQVDGNLVPCYWKGVNQQPITKNVFLQAAEGAKTLFYQQIGTEKVENTREYPGYDPTIHKIEIEKTSIKCEARRTPKSPSDTYNIPSLQYPINAYYADQGAQELRDTICAQLTQAPSGQGVRFPFPILNQEQIKGLNPDWVAGIMWYTILTYVKESKNQKHKEIILSLKKGFREEETIGCMKDVEDWMTHNNSSLNNSSLKAFEKWWRQKHPFKA